MKLDQRTPNRRLGDLGENIACKFLVKRGCGIVERNYFKKWGEIDIVAKRGEKYHFIEVKSVSRVTLNDNVTHVTDKIRPEDNMHPTKIRKLLRTIKSYLLHKKHEGEWQLDLITVKLDMKKRMARVEIIENIVI